MRQAGAEEIDIAGDTVAGVVVDGELVAARSVVIAGGAWSPSLARPLQITVPVTPQRGQIIHLALPGVATANWPVILPLHGHYMVPWPDQRVVVGATREFAGFEPHTTVDGVREVLDEALRVAPGLAGASLGEIRVGLRPSTPDGLPLLGPLPAVRNVYLATGHGATGLQLGPYSGKLIAEMALGSAPAMPLDPFSVTRF